MSDYLADLIRMFLYPALAVIWMVNAFLMIPYYLNVLRHRLTLITMLCYVALAASFTLLSLITGLSPMLPSDIIIPWLVVVRMAMAVGGVGIGWELWRRLRE